MKDAIQIGLPERAAAMRGFERASAAFDRTDAVHAEARRRLQDRLELVQVEPACILDLGSATGKGAVELAATYSGATVIAVDRSLAMLEHARRRVHEETRVEIVAGEAERVPLADHSVDLVFANLLLPWCRPDAVFAEVARVLREGGVFGFTTVGPDTLAEVRQAWAGVDDAIHVHGFVDMHDLGDLLLRAGLAEPVMDVDRLEVTYEDVGVLVDDLRGCGASNVAAGRRCTLTGRERWSAFREALEGSRDAGRFSVTVELIFGQAFGRGQGSRREGSETVVSLDDVKRQLR